MKKRIKDIRNILATFLFKVKGRLLNYLVAPFYDYRFLSLCTLFLKRDRKGTVINKLSELRDLINPSFLAIYKDILSWQNREIRRIKISEECCRPEDYGRIKFLYERRVSHNGKPGRSRKLFYEMIWETVWVVLNMDLRDGQRITDIGAENSCLSPYFAYSGCTAYGLDVFIGGYGEYFKNNILRLCYNSTLILDVLDRGGKAQNIIYKIEDATKLTVEDNFFDRIVCVSTIEHIWNDTKAIQEMARVLKPGGILAITCPFGLEYYQNAQKVDDGLLYHDAGRIYTEETLFTRLINPSGLELIGEKNFSLSRQNWWRHHFPMCSEKFVSAAIFLRKKQRQI